LRKNSKSGIERLYKNPKSPENTPKNTNKQQSTENKRVANAKNKLGRGLVFTLSFVGGRFAPLPPVSYVSDQVHLKHEQSQGLWIESHVTIGTIQQTQDADNVL